MKTQRMMPCIRWALGLVVTVPLLAAAADEIDRIHPVSLDGLVQVENMAGSVEFTVWESDEVHIQGRLADDVEEVEIETTANGLRVVVRNKKDQRQIDSTHLRLKVPKGASIEAEGVSSDLSVEGSEGDSISLSTVSGDIEVDAVSRRVDLDSVSGDVEFEGVAQRITVESISGDVVLIGAEKEVEAKTVSGDVTMEAERIDNGRFETVSGELNLMLELADGGRLNGDAMSGDINLRLPSSQQAEFFAQSYSGDISSEFGDPKHHSRSSTGSILKARAGDNGARIRLETFSGDVSIRSW